MAQGNSAHSKCALSAMILASHNHPSIPTTLQPFFKLSHQGGAKSGADSACGLQAPFLNFTEANSSIHYNVKFHVLPLVDCTPLRMMFYYKWCYILQSFFLKPSTFVINNLLMSGKCVLIVILIEGQYTVCSKVVCILVLVLHISSLATSPLFLLMLYVRMLARHSILLSVGTCQFLKLGF